MNMICPKCQRIMSYDPYFKANVCRQCGTTERVPTVEVTTKRIIEVRTNKIQERKMARAM
jgi:hypothetical protein